MFRIFVLEDNCSCMGRACSPGGHLYLMLDIISVKKIHVIRVVFQDQAMYARTSFRGAKTCKIGKKGMFWSY